MHPVRPFVQALLLLVALLVPPTVRAQAPDTTGATRGDRLRVFLDCQPELSACRNDYYVVELPFADWTRDRLFADVHLLVTSLTSGNGGREFSIVLIGQRRFAGERDTIGVRTLPGESEDNVRRALADAFRGGLFPFARRTTEGARLRVVYDAPAGALPARSASLRDPWNLWVIESSFGVEAEGESLRREIELGTFHNARRVTESWRLGVGGGGEYTEQVVKYGDGRPDTRLMLRNMGAYARAVRSLDAHWSAGLLLNVGRNDYSNIRTSLRAAPVIEYNLFPWREATRRQLLVAYGAGPVRFRYVTPTIFGETLETRPLHHLQAAVDTRLAWGSTNVTLRGTQFLHDTRLYRLTADASARFRLAKGLALEVGGEASKVADQIYLSARGATDEEVLAGQRARATSYEFDAYVSIRYTFGSIYNTIVNQRLEKFAFGPGGVF